MSSTEHALACMYSVKLYLRLCSICTCSYAYLCVYVCVSLCVHVYVICIVCVYVDTYPGFQRGFPTLYINRNTRRGGEGEGF